MAMLGIGVMLKALSGDDHGEDAVSAALGKTIMSIRLDEDQLLLGLGGGDVLRLWDDGQSCCEVRYMRTDDDFQPHLGTQLVSVELRDAPNENDDHNEVHQVQFLIITTTRGAFTISSHNEHNGYYGGFWIQAALDEAEDAPVG